MIYIFVILLTLCLAVAWALYRSKAMPFVRANNLLNAYVREIIDQYKGEVEKNKQDDPKAGRQRVYILVAVTAAISVLNIKLGIASLAISYLLLKRQSQPTIKITDRDIFENLPLELENIMMGVQAGNDLVQTLKKINNPEIYASNLRYVFSDILDRFSSGMEIGQAIDSVKDKYNNPKLSFVLNYLKISLKQGGEVISQLRELADAVTTQYQNHIEKEINKMPAKALFPLMLILTGMLIIYLTGPLVQVSNQLPRIKGSFTHRG